MSAELSRRAANVIEIMVNNGFQHSEKIVLSRLIDKANSFDDLPEKYRKAIEIAEKYQKEQYTTLLYNRINTQE